MRGKDRSQARLRDERQLRQSKASRVRTRAAPDHPTMAAISASALWRLIRIEKFFEISPPSWSSGLTSSVLHKGIGEQSNRERNVLDDVASKETPRFKSEPP